MDAKPAPPISDRMPFSHVVIVGVGLIGASLGLALKRQSTPPTLLGVARRPLTPAGLAAVDAWSSSIEAALERLPATAQTLVVLTVPLSQMKPMLASLKGFPGIITDAGSVKQTVVAEADTTLEAGHRFVGSHPMAGSERSGADAARADLFLGKPCVVTPTPATSNADLQAIEAFWQAVGMHTLRLSAREHDRQAAAVSHLPHAAACLLVEAAEAWGGQHIASTGFATTTRLAASNPPMRADIMLHNREQLSDALRDYRDRIDQLLALLDRQDHPALLARLHAIAEVRQHWTAPSLLPGPPPTPPASDSPIASS